MGADIDVVMVTYQSADTLREAVEALSGRWPVVVVDNDSRDGSSDLAESLGCHVVRNGTNRGFGAAVNQGAKLGSAELILLLNPDAVVAPDAVLCLVDALADEGVAVAGPRLILPDGSDQRPWWPFPSAEGSWRQAFGLHRKAFHPETSRDVDFAVGACLVIRRSVFEMLGGFDERYWLYGEETDLCRRVHEVGLRVRYVAEARARHASGASGLESPGLTFEHFQRGAERFILSWSGRAALVSHRAALLFGSAIRLPVLRLKVGDKDPRVITRRRIIRRLAKTLLRTPASLDRDRPDDMQHGRDLVVISLEAWDDTWRRNQFLVRELLAVGEADRVLFVEPPVDVIHELRRRTLPRHSRALRPVPGYPEVRCFQPRKVWPRVLGPFADRSLARQVLDATTRAEFVDPTLWVNDSAYVDLVDRVDWPVVYDITDDWIEASITDRERMRRESREKRLLAMCDEVVVCSPALLDRRSVDRPTDLAPIRLVPNAVDVEAFQRPRSRPSDLPPSPVAVYVGTLHDDRIDVDLVARLARELPEVTFAFVGPNALSAHSSTRLDAIDNVRLMGARPYESVPGYLQHADVIVVPHAVSSFTDSLDPIKLYECLAVGTPTVATPVAGFRSAPTPVRCADSAHFAEEVRQAVGSSGRRQHGLTPSWADRSRAFGDALRAAAFGDGA